MYVDDLLIASKDPTAKKKITDALFAEFAIKREGPLTWYLGIGYDKVAPEDGGGWKLSQKTFIQSLVRKTTTLSPRHTETKTRSRFRTPPPSEGEIEALEKSENVNLQQLIGSLLYVSTNTRPDIALAVSRIARYVTRPTKEIIRAAKHVVKYLHAKEDRGFTSALRTEQPRTSWLGEFQKHGNPRYGFVCKTAGSPITWKTSYVSHVCLSTCEAEYCALSLATEEALHIQQLQAEFRGVTAEYEMLRTGELPMVRESTKAFTRHIA